MPLPGFVAERIAKRTSPTEIDAAIPVFIRGSFAFFTDILKGEKFASGMVEDTVHHNADPVFVAELHKIGRSDAWLAKHLGMDQDEILRLKQITGLAEAFKNNEFSRSWTPGKEE